MTWYKYRQNNSFGFDEIDPDRGIGKVVYIEAGSAAEADARAKKIGLYFDPFFERDCECCGTRWGPMDASWSQVEGWTVFDRLPAVEDSWDSPVYAHPLDGPFLRVPAEDDD